MSKRPNPVRAAPETYQLMKALSDHTQNSGIEKTLLELVKIRASQINGCAFCISMHTQEARKLGETDERMLMLPVWPEAGLFGEREKAALAWTEALTLLAEAELSDELYQATRAHFSEQEIVDLSWTITVINGWNRMMAAFAVPPMKIGTK